MKKKFLYPVTQTLSPNLFFQNSKEEKNPSFPVYCRPELAISGAHAFWIERLSSSSWSLEKYRLCQQKVIRVCIYFRCTLYSMFLTNSSSGDEVRAAKCCHWPLAASNIIQAKTYIVRVWSENNHIPLVLYASLLDNAPNYLLVWCVIHRISVLMVNPILSWPNFLWWQVTTCHVSYQSF